MLPKPCEGQGIRYNRALIRHLAMHLGEVQANGQ
jgi:hypothetical protein